MHLAYTVCFLVVIASLTNVPVSDAAANRKRVKSCSTRQKEFLAWFCSIPNFDFPFDFSRPHLIQRIKPPREEIYPFQYQAATCCKEGCFDYEYEKMCFYYLNMERCEAGKDLATHEGRKGRADCLLGAASRRRSVNANSLLYKFKNV